jgi:hypothetical protein
MPGLRDEVLHILDNVLLDPAIVFGKAVRAEAKVNESY